MIFKDREEAARLLAEKLKKYRKKNPLVLGIPRGAIPMAKIIAEELHGELNAVLVHKIPAPFNEELAVASIGLSGEIHSLPYVKDFGIQKSYIKAEARVQLEKLRERQLQFGIETPQARDRIVIIVDDGIATGATAIGAIHEIRHQQPKKIILAAAVIASSTAKNLRPLVDDLVVLDEPEDLFAISLFFHRFEQVPDEEVAEIFKAFGKSQKMEDEDNIRSRSDAQQTTEPPERQPR